MSSSIDDSQKSNDFYRVVLGAELVQTPRATCNPLGAWAYRFGSNSSTCTAHGPASEVPCCEPPRNEPGRADLCFRYPGSGADASALLARHRIAIEAGPLPRFRARGWGTSVYPRPERQLDRAHLLPVGRHWSPTTRLYAATASVIALLITGPTSLFDGRPVDPDRHDDPSESVHAPVSRSRPPLQAFPSDATSP